MTKEFISIDNFISNSFVSRSKDLLRSNRFYIEFNKPVAKFSSEDDEYNIDSISDILSYNALSVSCPDITVDVGEYEINAWRQFYLKTRLDGDLTITWLETSEYKIRRFFNAWIKIGYNNVTRQRQYINTICAHSVKIFPLGPNGETTFCDRFETVFPFAINSLEYNVANDNTLLYTECRFKYKFHELTRA